MVFSCFGTTTPLDILLSFLKTLDASLIFGNTLLTFSRLADILPRQDSVTPRV